MALGMHKDDQNDNDQIDPFRIRYEMAVQTILLSTVVPDEARLILLRSYQVNDDLA